MIELSKLKCDKSAFPDGISNLIFIKCRNLLYLFYLLFEQFLSLGVFPDAWKVSRIVDIYKKGDKTDVSNYRKFNYTSYN